MQATLTWLTLLCGCLTDKPSTGTLTTPIAPTSQGEPIRLNLETAPHVVLITVDTLRADHLKLYGHTRETAPAISALATQGVTFMDAVAPAPWTLPTIASVHSSLYPSEHAVIGAKTRLDNSVETLAETLKRAGYRTIGVVSNRFASTNYGMAQGFDDFDDSQIVGHHDLSSEGITRIAIEKLGKADGPPVFLWAHYFDPHFTFVRHPQFGFAEGYTGRFDDQISIADVREAFTDGGVSEDDVNYTKDVYDEEIAFTDKWIGELLRTDGLNGARKTLTILTADHGEYFMERGRFFHGEDVYRELVHVPLIIAGDIDVDRHGTQVADTVSLTSIPATIMSHLGIAEHSFNGVNLLGSQEELRGVPVFAEGSHLWGRVKNNEAIITPKWKLIHTPETGEMELYNRHEDPAELDNLYTGSLSPELQPLLTQLSAFPAETITETAEAETSPETIRQLEALGYVE
jgi:arylsulfatase A-like enzyme